MKTEIKWSLLFIILLVSCQSNNSTKLLSVDVTSSSPTKKLLLQDIGDVEYVPLETSDEFITQAVVKDIGEKYIVVRNSINDGDIYLFTREGKAVRKINHKGKGAKDYVNIGSIILDEANDELFVYDRVQHRVLVYNISGEFKRSFQLDDSTHYEDISEYDSQHLIAYKMSSYASEDKNTFYVILDKSSGKVTKEQKLPTEKFESIIWMSDNVIAIPQYKNLSAVKNGFLLSSASSDTIYKYTNETLTPLVVRKPSIHDMEIKIFLYALTETNDYLFMRSYEKKYDADLKGGFKTQYYMYDKKEGKVYTPIIINADLGDDSEFEFSVQNNLSNNDIISYKSLEPSLFLEAYEDGHLSDNLKKMISSLSIESNNVIMIVKSK